MTKVSIRLWSGEKSVFQEWIPNIFQLPIQSDKIFDIEKTMGTIMQQFPSRPWIKSILKKVEKQNEVGLFRKNIPISIPLKATR